MYAATAVLNAVLSVWQKVVGEFVGFLVLGELVVGELVGFDEGLAVGELVGFDEGLAVGESVGFDKGLAVGESVGFNVLVGAIVGRRVGAMGRPMRHALLVCPPKAPLQHSSWLL